MGLCYFADGKDYYRYLVCHNTGSASDLPALQDRILEKRQSDLQQAAALLSENPQLKASQTTVRLPAADPIATLNGLQEAMRANFPAPPETTFTVSSIDECMEDYMAPAFTSPRPLTIMRRTPYLSMPPPTPPPCGISQRWRTRASPATFIRR